MLEVVSGRASELLDDGRLPGAGLGLVGLAERVALAGGSLEHGEDPAGRFVVRATLPWRVSESIRVLIVDDDALVRSGLQLMLAGAAGIDVVGEVADGRGVLAAIDRYHTDVVLMDIRMPQLDGIAATRLLRSQPRPPAVLMLTTFEEDELVLRALRAGAAGFLVKDTPPAEIVRAIELVSAGESMLSPTIARRLVALVAGDPDTAARYEDAREKMALLSGREREVALAVGRGLANADIAGELYMSTATVKAHVSRLLTKLEVDNRVQIALLVREAEN